MGDAESVKSKLQGIASEAFITAFCMTYTQYVNGITGMMPESTIMPAEVETTYESLPDVGFSPELLKKTVVIKLNGGLGTSMGLEGPKSLLPIRPGLTFMDVICRQLLHLRDSNHVNIPFLLMNSFATSAATQEYLSTHFPSLAAEPWELLQHQAPKIDVETKSPVSHPPNPAHEWCPPGHGDLFSALVGRGTLDTLLAAGVEYAFVSNGDNLGATLSARLLAHFAQSQSPMLMEVCVRTPNDRKGGHLAARVDDAQLVLRELANCPEEDKGSFQDINKHRYFNTNTLWFNLPLLKAAIDAHGGALPLPLIVNRKTVDPRDPSSVRVVQLETAMGAAVALLPGATAVVVPRTRFAPVKTTGDLLLLRSDLYEVDDVDGTVRRAPHVGSATGAGTAASTSSAATAAAGTAAIDPSTPPPLPTVELVGYDLVDTLDLLCPAGVPSLRGATHIAISGPVAFEGGSAISGKSVGRWMSVGVLITFT